MQQGTGRSTKLPWVAKATSILIMCAAVRADVVELTNADVSDGDGKLEMAVDDFGFWGDIPGACTGPEVHDYFDPGPVDPNDPQSENPGREFASFFAFTILHVNAAGKVGLSMHPCVEDNFNNEGGRSDGRGGPADFELTLVQPNSTSSLPESTDSVFDVTDQSGDVNIRVHLTQAVHTGKPGPNGELSAYIDQTYALTNQGASTLELIMIRHNDQDMPWSTSGSNFSLDDIVGVDFAEHGFPEVFAQDGDLNTAALVLRTREDMTLDARTTQDGVVYYVTKDADAINQPPVHPVLPPGPPCYEDPSCPQNSLCPPNAGGTDHFYWERPGVPNCWRNYVPGVGRDVPGASPQVDGDASIGYQVGFSLPPEDTYELTFRTQYGFRPIPPRFQAPNTKALLVDGHVDSDGVGEFLLTLKNVNPGGGQAPDDIRDFYLDIEAGSLDAPTAAGERDLALILPAGWDTTNCTGFDNNGHALVRIELVDDQAGHPVLFGQTFRARVRIRTNDLTANVNPATGVIVPALSVVMSVAQDHPEGDWTAVCVPNDYSFGPTQENGFWSNGVQAKAYLQVPALSHVGRSILLVALAISGLVLVQRSRHFNLN